MPIRKVKGGYKIDNVAGISKTKKEAEDRQRAIKARQSKTKKVAGRRPNKKNTRTRIV